MITEAEILQGKILIVDDQEVNILMLERMLRGAGYLAVSSTRFPREVCELHRKNRYDLILLDLQMPGQDGFSVMEDLKAVESDGYLPVLVVTAEPAHKLSALKAGAKDFVSKPFDLAEVLFRVRNMVEVRLLHEAARDHGKRLESLALNDPLTGLANRRLLSDRMSMALAHAKRNKSAMAVVYLDLDGFKEVNEAWGHGVGDALLKQVAGRLVASVREEDMVARLGGDEFLVAIHEVADVGDADAMTTRILGAVSEPYTIDGHSIRMTISAGIAVYPAHGQDAASVIDSADKALGDAKRAGKNCQRVSEHKNLAVTWQA